MLELIESSDELLKIELDMINSNPFFNRISNGKNTVTEEEVKEENRKSKEMGAERYLLHNGKEYVGIIDFLMKNPSDGEVWLGLLLIKHNFQAQGVGYEALNKFYEILKDRQINKFRIGVIVENKPAHQFWLKQDFRKIHSAKNQNDKEIVIYEKRLTPKYNVIKKKTSNSQFNVNQVDFYELGTIVDEKLTFAVISSNYKGGFVLVRHKERQTWEIPGGSRENEETIDETGKRELVEETGAKQFIIKPACECSFIINGSVRFGRLYSSEIFEFGELPDLEIGEVKIFENIPVNLTYPEVQPILHKKALELKSAY